MGTYCQLSDVKSILMNTVNEKVHFSNNSISEVKTLRYAGINTAPSPFYGSIFNYRLITIDDEFDFNGFLRFRFTSDTEFDVYEVNTTDSNYIKISTGDINNIWDHPQLNSLGEPILTIPVGCWVSGFVTDVSIQIKFITNISSSRAEVFIGETEIMIDQMLSKMMLFKLNDTGLNYASGAVPQQISLACKYLTSYYMYVSLYSNTFINKDKSLDFSLVSRWKTKAEEMVTDFANIKGRHIPSVIGFPSFMDKMGVDGEGPGFASQSSNFDDLNRDAQTDSILSDS